MIIKMLEKEVFTCVQMVIIMPSIGNMNSPFLNRRTKIYRPRTQEILDNSAQRQYVSQEAVRLINENTGTEIGKDIVDDFNKPGPSGGKEKVLEEKEKENKQLLRKEKEEEKIN